MSKVLGNRCLLVVFLAALVGLLLLPVSSDVAWAKRPPKPPKPTPTPAPDPDPEIVYVHKTRKGNVWSSKIMVMNADGSNQTEVVDCGTYSCTWPDWSPDGSQIIFVSNAFDLSVPPYSEAIYVVNLDGGFPQKIVDLNGGTGQPAWSPGPIGGQDWIVYSDETLSNPEGGYHDLYAYGLSDGTVVQLTFFQDITVSEPAWSADGAYLAALLKWDLHPWHVHTNIFEVDVIGAYPALRIPQIAIKYDQYGLQCGFGTPDWSNEPGDYRMLAMCGLEITYLLDFGDSFDLVWDEEYQVWFAHLAGPPVDLRQQIPPSSGPEGIYGIWVQDGRFSPDNTKFVFGAVFRDKTLKATGIYVGTTDNSGPVVELIKLGINQGSVKTPEWRPPFP